MKQLVTGESVFVWDVLVKKRLRSLFKSLRNKEREKRIAPNDQLRGFGRSDVSPQLRCCCDLSVPLTHDALLRVMLCADT